MNSQIKSIEIQRTDSVSNPAIRGRANMNGLDMPTLALISTVDRYRNGRNGAASRLSAYSLRDKRSRRSVATTFGQLTPTMRSFPGLLLLPLDCRQACSCRLVSLRLKMRATDKYDLYKTNNSRRAELGRARHSLSRRSENHLADDSPIVRKSLWRCPQFRKCRD